MYITFCKINNMETFVVTLVYLHYHINKLRLASSHRWFNKPINIGELSTIQTKFSIIVEFNFVCQLVSTCIEQESFNSMKVCRMLFRIIISQFVTISPTTANTKTPLQMSLKVLTPHPLVNTKNTYTCTLVKVWFCVQQHPMTQPNLHK